MKVMEICSKGVINLKKEEIEEISKKTEDISADNIESIDWSLYLPRVTFTGWKLYRNKNLLISVARLLIIHLLQAVNRRQMDSVL